MIEAAVPQPSNGMSASPPIADIREYDWDVR